MKSRFYTTPGYIFSKLFSIIPSFRIVNFILRFFSNRIGRGVTIHNNVRFLVIKNINIGNNSTINANSLLDSRMGINIGSNTMIGNGTKIFTLTHDVEDKNFISKGKAVFIGNNVVLFPQVTVMPGVNIGNGAVIYPGAIVTKDVKPYSKMAGVPAKKVGERNLKEFNYKLNYKTYWGI
tara:strand:+ start:55 stop:591 length:537 start_codon:yes stop_codon:yes gene_type:complete